MSYPDLTPRQAEILRIIREFLEVNEYPPTIREIAASMAITHRGASDHLKALERKGVLARMPGKARGLRILIKQ